MNICLRRFLVAAPALWILTARLQAVVIDPALDFSISNGNPNGDWTYGQYDTGFTTFTAHTLTVSSSGPDYFGWKSSTGDGLNPSILMSSGGDPVFGVAAGSLGLHPGPSGEASTVRWTAPGSFNGPAVVAGNFGAGNSGSMTVGIRYNGVSQFTATDSGTFNLNLPVSPGDTVEFVVYGGYVSGSTELNATITPVPEPAQWAVIVAGVSGALGFCRRARRA